MDRKSNCLSPNSSTLAVSRICMLLAGVPSVLAQPAEIILLRHAEKPPDESNVHLSTTGKERARALVQFFTNTPALTPNGLPVALFAARPLSRSHSRRPAETLLNRFNGSTIRNSTNHRRLEIHLSPIAEKPGFTAVAVLTLALGI